MKGLNILIVEDETPLAEMHAELIKQSSLCRQIWLAGNIQQAKIMTERLKPDLILLDNYLPDGKGIEFLEELNSNKFTGGIIFITAASDMKTVSDAVRLGVFDYLIKPVAYERLEHSINRYMHLNQVISENNHVTQRQVDDIFNAFSRGESKANFPIGIDDITLDKVKQLFDSYDVTYTAESVAQEMGLSRTTARRYLEYCSTEGFLLAEIVYGKVGRPQRLYRRNE